jgi:hypothetical protein
VHTVQLFPQWAESVAELHALSAHSVLPAGHIEAHDPALHTPADGHTVQLLPQCAIFEATQEPPHKTIPEAHTHDPPWQVVPVPQIAPHTPQFWLSFVRTMHELPHAVSPAAHEGPSVELPSRAPPSAPSPGAATPEAQLTTMKTTEQAIQAKAKREKWRPSMSRLFTGGREMSRLGAKEDATALALGFQEGGWPSLPGGSETRVHRCTRRREPQPFVPLGSAPKHPQRKRPLMMETRAPGREPLRSSVLALHRLGTLAMQERSHDAEGTEDSVIVAQPGRGDGECRSMTVPR